MTQQEIENILKMRLAVYKAGVKAGYWKNLDEEGASDVMNYIFHKSGHIAYYNLILELVRNEHSNIIKGGAYSLFKMPVQVEKEVMDYLKKENPDLSKLVTDEESFLKEMDTIVTNHGFVSVCIGSYSASELDNILRLCASHYRYSFMNKLQSYPYFE